MAWISMRSLGPAGRQVDVVGHQSERAAAKALETLHPQSQGLSGGHPSLELEFHDISAWLRTHLCLNVWLPVLPGRSYYVIECTEHQ